MHSVESLRRIRAMEYALGIDSFCLCDARHGRSHAYTPPRENEGGEVIAVLVYDLETREITVEDPPSTNYQRQDYHLI